MFLQDSDSPTFYALCGPLNLNEGILVSQNLTTPVRYILSGTFQQQCYEGSIPMLNTNVDLILNQFSEPLPIIQKGWEEYTLRPGSFVNGIVPVLYSISFLAVVTWFLTVFVVTNLKKSSLFLQGSTSFALIYMILIVVKSLICLHFQQRNGYFDGQKLMAEMTNTTWLSAIDLVVILFLQINQVQVVMRLFSRQGDKRIIFLVGVSAAIASQVLWSVMKFHPFEESKEVKRILPSLTYLVRIATNIIYATIFTAFTLTKTRTLLANRGIWLITVLSLIFIYAPVAFFVADVTTPWAHEFSVVTYVVCVVLPWEWCNSYQLIQKIQEREGVLGRKFYEDELCELDRLGLFVEEENDDDFGSHYEVLSVNFDESHDNDGSSNTDMDQSTNDKPSDSLSRQATINLQTTASKFADKGIRKGSAAQHNGSHIAFASLDHLNFRKSGVLTKAKLEGSFSKFKDRFWSATDTVIAYGLELPRPGSRASTFRQTPPSQSGRDSLGEDDHRRIFHLKRIHRKKTNVAATTPNPNRPNRDVFLYTTKNVVINADE
ncbi:hypothetical protein PUMCH_002188 [Australozyma saopauloensis]|uniref:pH-response regulator protein palH/RIM21 n=1 Tax=Australozyma saopauloensis TaxID=291208 RepID=A0AAX4H8T1_9ASCO|nr:hypothetical protein PUMCH_002188 [[Candida] saopauloensis]